MFIIIPPLQASMAMTFFGQNFCKIYYGYGDFQITFFINSLDKCKCDNVTEIELPFSVAKMAVCYYVATARQ